MVSGLRPGQHFSVQVNESFPFPIALSWKGSAPDTQNGAMDNQQITVVFPTGNPIPSMKALTFYRSGTFTIDVQYADVSELQAPAKISTYTVIYIRFIHSIHRVAWTNFLGFNTALVFYFLVQDWTFPILKWRTIETEGQNTFKLSWYCLG